MRPFTWLAGAPKAQRALALAALRPTQRFAWTLDLGPVLDAAGAPRTGVSVELGLYAQPHEDLPVHSTLAGLAEERAPGRFARGFFLRDLVAHVVPRAGQTLYGCADGPGWRVAVPVVVVPDARALRDALG